MDEKYIIDMLVLNGVNYHKFKDLCFENAYGHWLEELRKLKGFKDYEETTDYLFEVIS